MYEAELIKLAQDLSTMYELILLIGATLNDNF